MSANRLSGRLKYVFIVLGVAFALRATVAVIIIVSFPNDKFDYYVDTRGYMLLARNLLEGNGFSGSASPPYAPDSFRTPGFPLLIALIYWLFNYHIAPFFFLNALLSAVTCALMFLIFQRYLEQRVAFLGSLLLALDVDSIMYANFILTETLYTLILILAAYFLFKYLQTDRLPLLLASSICLGADAYVRPTCIFTAALIFIGMGVYHRFRGNFRWQRVAFGLVVFLAILTPWYLRNGLLTGRYEMSSIGVSRTLRYSTRAFAAQQAHARGITLRKQLFEELNVDEEVKAWLARNPDFTLSADGMPVSDVRQYKYLSLVTPRARTLLMQNWKKVLFTHLYSSLGSLISTDWWGFNANILHNHFDMGPDVRSTIFWMFAGNAREAWQEFSGHRGSIIMLLSFCWTFINYLFAVWGFMWLWREGSRDLAVFIFLMVMYHVFVGGVDALARFRVPILPYTMGLSAIGMWRVFRRKERMIFRAPQDSGANPAILAQS